MTNSNLVPCCTGRSALTVCQPCSRHPRLARLVLVVQDTTARPLLRWRPSGGTTKGGTDARRNQQTNHCRGGVACSTLPSPTGPGRIGPGDRRERERDARRLLPGGLVGAEPCQPGGGNPSLPDNREG